MSMAKTAKTINVSLETRAADILYDSAQECDMSLTAFIEHTAYFIGSNGHRGKWKDRLKMIVNSKEPEQ